MREYAVFVAAGALLAACATQPVPMATDARQALQTVDCVLLMPSGGLDVTVTSTYAGPGLLPALLAAYADTKRQETAAAAATPVLSELQTYDFRSVMRNAWSQEMSQITVARFIVPAQVLATRPDAADFALRKLDVYDRSAAGAVLFAAIDPQLQSGTLVVAVTVEVYPKSAALMKYRTSPSDTDPLAAGNVLYRNTFTHTKEFITPSNVRRSLDAAAGDIARKVAVDIGSLSAPK